MTESNKLTRRRFLGRTLAAGAASCVAARPAFGSEATAAYWRDEGWQIGCWTRPWAKYDYRVAMDAAGEAGYKFIALTGAKTSTGRVIASATTPEEAGKVGEEARKRGLQIPCAYGGRFPANKSLEEGIDGLVHISQISDEHIERIKDVLNVGDSIEARVVKVDPVEHRIGLSIKAAKVGDEDFEVEEGMLEGLQQGAELVNLAGAFDNAFGDQLDEWHPGDSAKKDEEQEEKGE